MVEVKADRLVQRQTYLLSGITLIFFLASSMIEPILPLFVIGVGASKFQLGLIMALRAVTGIVTRMPLGIVSDKVGRWPMLPISMLMTSVSFAMYSLIPEILWFYPIMALSALAQVSVLPTLHAIASDLASTTKRGEAIGRYLSMIGIAMMAGPFLGSFLVNYLDYRSMFLIAAVFPLTDLIIVLIARLYKLTGSIQEGKVDAVETKDKRNLSHFKAVITSGSVPVVCSTTFFNAVSMGIFDTLFSVYAMEKLLLTPSIISLLFAVRGAANTIIRVPIGRMSDKVGRKKPFLMGFCLLFLAFLALSLAKNVLIVASIMAIYGLGWGMRAVVSVTSIGDSVPLEDRGTAMAFFLLMFDVGGVIGPLIAGWSASFFPTQTIFQFLALIVLPTIPMLSKSKTVDPKLCER